MLIAKGGDEIENGIYVTDYNKNDSLETIVPLLSLVYPLIRRSLR